MENIRKIKIVYLSDIAKRVENTRRILMNMENGNIVDAKHNSFSTSNAVYVFVNCKNPRNAKGIWADQVIIDFREPMRSLAIDILRMSCIPAQYQIIDDREIEASDS